MRGDAPGRTTLAGLALTHADSAGETLENVGELVCRLRYRAARRGDPAARTAAVVPTHRPEREQPDVIGVRPRYELVAILDLEDPAVEVAADHRCHAEHPPALCGGLLRPDLGHLV